MKNIDFILNKLRHLTNSKTDKELCEVLDINYSTLDTWKNNDNIPRKRLLEFSQKLNISFEDLNYKGFFMDFDIYFERLFNHFNTSTIRELSEKINMSESTISKWRQRESINAIKKKCRELGIYNEIFGDLKLSSNENQSQQIKEICNTGEIIETDEATFSLYKEAYLKAKKNEKIKEFRIYLMEYK